MEKLCDGKHGLDRYVEIGGTYDMTQSNTVAFKTLNVNASANSLDVIKTYKVKVNHAHIGDLVLNLVYAKSKKQTVKFFKNFVTVLKFLEVNTINAKQNNERSSNQPAKFTRRKYKYQPFGRWWWSHNAISRKNILWLDSIRKDIPWLM